MKIQDVSISLRAVRSRPGYNNDQVEVRLGAHVEDGEDHRDVISFLDEQARAYIRQALQKSDNDYEEAQKRAAEEARRAYQEEMDRRRRKREVRDEDEDEMLF